MGEHVLGFLSPDCTDARTIKRIKAFQDNRFHVIGLTFRRDRYNSSYQPDWENIDFGHAHDRRYGYRLLALLRALAVCLRHRRRLQRLDSFYAINLDMAIIAVCLNYLFRVKAPLVYEVADIQPVMMKQNILGKVLRFLERRILKRTELLITTSPAFVDHYFKPVQHYEGPWEVLENKLYEHPEQVDADRRSPCEDGTWKVGYFGALRCSKSWSMIKAIAHELPDQVSFYLRGYPTKIDKDDFWHAVHAYPNIIYEGPYDHVSELAQIYSRIDLAWCFEFLDEDHNSRWLLPNRIYEAGYFRVPMLAAHGFQVGHYVEEMEIGWTFREPYADHLIDFLENLSVNEYMQTKEILASIPTQYFASKQDFRNVCDHIHDVSGEMH